MAAAVTTAAVERRRKNYLFQILQFEASSPSQKDSWYTRDVCAPTANANAENQSAMVIHQGVAAPESQEQKFAANQVRALRCFA
jgi:hypothetical protein